MRAIVLTVVYPLINIVAVYWKTVAHTYVHYGLTPKEAALVTWGGLRGAVGLALAVSVLDTISIGVNVLFYTGGIVILTVLINGPSQPL